MSSQNVLKRPASRRLGTCGALALCLAAGSTHGQASSADEESKVPSPHPLITEVLVNVPPGEFGDANKDGTRDANKDEFVELVNPHSRTIDLTGYTLGDRNAGGQGAVEFTFPAFKLEPGEVVVVFNGGAFGSQDVGTGERAPKAKHDDFDAYVFTMGELGRFSAFSNKGDWVLLSDPDGKPVQVISWGTFDEELPSGEGLVAETPEDTSDGSLCRYMMGGPIVGHSALDGRLMSPGRHPIEATRAGEADGGGR